MAASHHQPSGPSGRPPRVRPRPPHVWSPHPTFIAFNAHTCPHTHASNNPPLPTHPIQAWTTSARPQCSLATPSASLHKNICAGWLPPRRVPAAGNGSSGSLHNGVLGRQPACPPPLPRQPLHHRCFCHDSPTPLQNITEYALRQNRDVEPRAAFVRKLAAACCSRAARQEPSGLCSAVSHGPCNVGTESKTGVCCAAKAEPSTLPRCILAVAFPASAVCKLDAHLQLAGGAQMISVGVRPAAKAIDEEAQQGWAERARDLPVQASPGQANASTTSGVTPRCSREPMHHIFPTAESLSPLLSSRHFLGMGPAR